MAKFCQNCGSEVKETAQWCDHCGAPLANAPAMPEVPIGEIPVVPTCESPAVPVYETSAYPAAYGYGVPEYPAAPGYETPGYSPAPVYDDPDMRYGAPAGTDAAAPGTEKRKKNPVIWVILATLLVGVGLAAWFLTGNLRSYNHAMDLKNNGQYDEAIAELTELGDYRDSADQINECLMFKVDALSGEGNYDEALRILDKIPSTTPGKQDLQFSVACRLALDADSDGTFSQAANILSALDTAGYPDAHGARTETYYRWAQWLSLHDEQLRALQTISVVRTESTEARSLYEDLQHDVYRKAIEFYYAKDYHGAKENFSAVYPYEESTKYLTLVYTVEDGKYASSPISGIPYGVDAVVDLIGFADAAEVLVSTNNLAKEFLCGRWEASYLDRYYQMDENGHTSVRFPTVLSGNWYYYFEDGIEYIYTDSKANSRPNIRITVISEDEIKIEYYKDHDYNYYYRQH